MLVHEMKWENVMELKKCRAEWGHTQYGDADIWRDTAKDVLEEAVDQLAILDRAIHHEQNERTRESLKIHRYYIAQHIKAIFQQSQEISKLIHNKSSRDIKDVKRIWFEEVE